ncbi:type II CRISPR RNA-guided endonuclease Cas9 [Anaerobutyricum hallii]|uniref:type II CRISPR RNA-guided endonuclease Cas9 n=2 Tax=Anaerobutyricum hallii TaxID=39488 RepID=UPI0039A114B5
MRYIYYRGSKVFCQEGRKVQMSKKYYLGLDIGTNSVGWAVTDENYNLCKYAGKRMWGIRLFEGGETAEQRRISRSNRRRLSRKKQRIDLLQELFAEEIAKMDPTFFIRLNESRLHLEDKSTGEKFPLFTDKDYTDIQYYKEYPTMYHLRKELIENSKVHDVRLVYLACHHILKNRGHFLINGSFSDVKKLSSVCESMLNSFNGISKYQIEINDIERLEEILSDRKKQKSVKAKELIQIFECGPCEDKTDEKTCKAIVSNLSKWLTGLKGNINSIFDMQFEEIDTSSFSFTEPKYEDTISAALEEKYPDYADVIQKIKTVYDWSVLVEIMAGEDYLSFAKVNAYNKHKENLCILKEVIRKYCDSEMYHKFFNGFDEKNGYGNYIGSIYKNGHSYAMKKCSTEDFYKTLGKILDKIQPEKEDENVLEELKVEVKNQTLLPLARTTANGTIPNQVHIQELKAILDNAKKYLPFLNEKDEYGTVAEKIISIAKFRIPYYVGPLSTRHKKQGANSWIVRKQEGRIYPWNFEEMVDLEQSNKEFIQRMTNKCTHLIGEDVLPKNSLLYSRYMVLNELNNLRIRGNKISVNLKQELYKELFCTKAKVTGKGLFNYLKKEDEELALEDISGFDIDFKSSLTSYLDFKKQILGEEIEKDKYKDIVENIIKWKTIYDDDSKMMKKMIEREYPNVFSKDQIKKICRFKYSGWGNFSLSFLNGIRGADRETGENFTIIEALWKTNYNLMQLLSKQFTFREEIDLINADKVGKIDKVSYDNTVKDLIVSPANKRAIWQTVQITEEIKKVMKCEPERIFIEMARGGEKEKRRTVSRKARLLELYAACKDDVRDWTKEIENREEREFNSKKLYLYYTQMGRCMYSGEEIDIDELMQKNSKWDIDHIYPQSKIKDDSIDNMVLAKKVINNSKQNKLLSPDIRIKMKKYWNTLYKGNFISKKKYDRLTRTEDFTNEELSGFIERQIVETRQSSKAVAELLNRLYEHSEIVYVKAGLVSDFRHDNKLLKSRRINDYHHAKDAFLNIVVGNVYNAKFTSNPRKWIKENRGTNYSIRRVFDYNVKRGNTVVWQGVKDAGHSIEAIRKTMARNDILYTEYTYCDKGELFNATLVRKGNDKAINLKKDLDSVKYGGYNTPKTSAFAFIEFDGKKKERKNHIVEIPVYIVNIASRQPDTIKEYLEQKKGYKNVVVKKYPIKKNALIKVDGYLARLRGATEKDVLLKNAVQLVLRDEYSENIRKVEKYLENNIQYQADSKFEGFTQEDLNDLYDELYIKLKESIYNKRPANQLGTLEKGREKYRAIGDLREKAKIINNILALFQCDATTSTNLKEIGGTANAGNMAYNKNTLPTKKLILIHQSVTGLFETEEELV